MTSITNSQNINDWSNISNKVIEQFGDQGDFFRQNLLNPAIFSLLGDVKGKKILDAGSGTGYLSRLLTQKGTTVTGIEPATNLYNYAISREEKEPLGITYLKEDLSVWKPISNTFDIVVSNMVFMDIPNYKSAMKNCITSLKQNGFFIFSILHPCFEENVDWQKKQVVAIKEYFQEYFIKQMTGHFFHRTLSAYINFLIENGCSIEKVDEPQLSEDAEKQYPQHARDFHVPSFLLIKAKKN